MNDWHYETFKAKWTEPNFCQSEMYLAGYKNVGRGRWLVEGREKSISGMWIVEIRKTAKTERKARQLCRKYAEGHDIS